MASAEVIVPVLSDDEGEEESELPCFTSSLLLSPSDRLRLFEESDRLRGQFCESFDVAIGFAEETDVDDEKKEQTRVEVTGYAENVEKCLEALKQLLEKKLEEAKTEEDKEEKKMEEYKEDEKSKEEELGTDSRILENEFEDDTKTKKTAEEPLEERKEKKKIDFLSALSACFGGLWPRTKRIASE